MYDRYVVSQVPEMSILRLRGFVQNSTCFKDKMILWRSFSMLWCPNPLYISENLSQCCIMPKHIFLVGVHTDGFLYSHLKQCYVIRNTWYRLVTLLKKKKKLQLHTCTTHESEITWESLDLFLLFSVQRYKKSYMLRRYNNFLIRAPDGIWILYIMVPIWTATCLWHQKKN